MLRQRFRVQEKIGAALYGDVWLCEDTRDINELVAVKHVSLTCARRALTVNRHMDNPWNERRLVSRLMRLGPHENILQFRAEFVENNAWYLAMEYCAGGDLLSLLQASPDNRLPEPIAVTYFRQIVRGVSFLHFNGLAHRDLSLENVLLKGNICKICDFGLAIETTRMCKESVGKAYYMAPEVVACEEYDPAAADMWSLGIMFFIMLTGSPLTPSATPHEKAFMALKNFGIAKILEVWGLSSAISSSTVDLLSGLLQIDPAKRLTIDDVLIHPAVWRE